MNSRKVWQARVACGLRKSTYTLEDPRVIHQILAHLGLPTEVPRPPPARAADLFSDTPA